MDAIILQAKANSGKTNTCKYLAKLIINKNKNYTFIKGALTEKDFILHVHYNNKNIIIFSMGDYGDIIEKDYTEIKDKYKNMDIIFGTCRTKGDTVKAIKKMAELFPFNIIWTSTYTSKINQDNLNIQRASELFHTFCEK